MSENIIENYQSYYFIGIGGVSMSALAKILLACGKTVGGCDRIENEYVAELKALGAQIDDGREIGVDSYQVVVYTDAIAQNNAALVLARRLKKLIIPRGKLLYFVGKLFKKTIAVSGCHGKTTCTAMLAHVFDAAEFAFSSHIGGSDLKFSNAYMGGFDYFITEACEYKRNFLHLKPGIGVVLNIDADHLDCYGSFENLKRAYAQFECNSSEVVRLYGEGDNQDCLTFGFDGRADYYAKKIKNLGGKFSFDVYEGNDALGRVSLNCYGKHNVLNALAAAAVARRCGIGFDSIAKGLKNFKGVKRRFEEIGSFNGAKCIADYAHHPDEIRAVIKTAKLITEGRLHVVFQPHTYSRTKCFFKQFVSVLSQQKKLLIYKTFAAREYYDDAGSALTLATSVRHSLYGDCEDDIKTFLKKVNPEDVVLFLGAGDIYDIAKSVLNS